MSFSLKPLLRREIRILAQLGLGVAPRFLQKVRARPEILTNKLGLLPRREAAPAARRPNLFLKISGRALTFCKNLGATPNPNQPKCEFTRRNPRQRLIENQPVWPRRLKIVNFESRYESFTSFESFQCYDTLSLLPISCRGVF